ncbi:MAG: hypothetical protein D6761_01375 [Candidatus Dadabacteria bacterium]|nr:MAG: hypothetical protein D6761_01375 [Candidatus Dadabacteria bacterium]
MLFLLKEVNDPGPDGGGWDLRKFLRDGARAATWNNVCRWLRGINNLPHDTPWVEVADMTESDRRQTLASIAAMNLKKSPGGHTTVVSSFWEAASEDASFLREQFSLYQADLVICCGSIVRGAFDAFIKPESASAWKATSRGAEFLEYSSGKYVIAYSHPAARVSANLLHYGLVDAIREILNGTCKTGQ